MQLSKCERWYNNLTRTYQIALYVYTVCLAAFQIKTSVRGVAKIEVAIATGLTIEVVDHLRIDEGE